LPGELITSPGPSLHDCFATAFRAFFRIVKRPTPFAFPFLVALICLSSWGGRGAEPATNAPMPAVRLPIEFRAGSLMVKTRINESEPLTFELDTGFGITTLHPSLVEPLNLKQAGTLTIIGIAGRETATTYQGASFDFGGATYSPRRVAVLPSDGERKRKRRDGILGAGFFRRFVVEVNPAEKIMILHDPNQFEFTGKGEIIPMEFREDTPIVEASIRLADGSSVKGKFEIDCGCDGALCVGHEFVVANHLDDLKTGEDSSRSGVGGKMKIRDGHVPALSLGGLTLEKLPASFFLESSPAGEGLAGHIGLGTLRRYRFILDYSRKRLILQ
jgi:predicted aspartyl protease